MAKKISKKTEKKKIGLAASYITPPRYAGGKKGPMNTGMAKNTKKAGGQRGR